MPWSKRVDSDLTVGIGDASAWVPGAFTSDRMLTSGVHLEIGVGASYELVDALALSFRATAFAAYTGGQQPNSMGYQPGYGFFQAGVPFEVGVRKRW